MHLVLVDAGDGPVPGICPAGADSGHFVRLADVAPQAPTDLVELAAAAPEFLADVQRRVDAYRGPVSALADVRLLAPVPRPGKIIGIGLNYRDHAAETGQDIPTTPVVFAKFSTSVSGPYDPIVYPAQSTRLDYEAELGVVIGRRCWDVSLADAPSAIAGYVVLNDVSARDVQNETSQWTLGKSFPGFAPIGPALVTADSVPDPQDLDISLRVNGAQRQSSNTANMIFGVVELVSRLSRYCILEPGDIIATGTPGGVGIGFRPERLLDVGDVVDVRIEGIGGIRNQVVAPGTDR